MTDKQIIIDGVNVNECDFYWYSGNHGELTHYCTYQKDEDGLDTHCNADFNKNCFYKEILRRLKRKEQENKDLRDDIKDIANLLDLDTGEEYNFGNIKLEIEELKQQLDQLKEAIEKIKEICQIKQSQSVFVNETVFEQILQIIEGKDNG